MEDIWCIEVYKDPSNHPEEGLCFVLAFPHKLLSLVPALEDNPTQFNMNIRLGCSFDYILLTQLLTILSHLFLSCCCLGEIHVSILTNPHVNYLLTTLFFFFLVVVLVQWGCSLSGDLQHIGDSPKQILSKTRKKCRIFFKMTGNTFFSPSKAGYTLEYYYNVLMNVDFEYLWWAVVRKTTVWIECIWDKASLCWQRGEITPFRFQSFPLNLETGIWI